MTISELYESRILERVNEFKTQKEKLAFLSGAEFVSRLIDEMLFNNKKDENEARA